MLCDYQKLPDGRWKCSACADETSRVLDAPPRRTCGVTAVDVPRLPPLRERLANFKRASIEHAKAGFPTCTDEQIAERLEICRTCDLFVKNEANPQIGWCSKCGCPASDLLPKYISKLAWADQECPIGAWPKL